MIPTNLNKEYPDELINTKYKYLEDLKIEFD
jgi:hypothetical protein